jgi:hypothetical protein
VPAQAKGRECQDPQPSSQARYIALMRSIGRALPSTVRPCRRKKGHRDGPEPDGSRQAGDEAPPRRGRRRHAARTDADRGQLQRQPDAGSYPRRGPGGAAPAGVAARGVDPTSCMPTRATIIVAAGTSAALATSRRGSLIEESRAANTWAAAAGSWSAPWLGWPASADGPSATRDAPTFTSPSPDSPVSSSAGHSSNGFVPDSKPTAGRPSSHEAEPRHQASAEPKQLLGRMGNGGEHHGGHGEHFGRSGHVKWQKLQGVSWSGRSGSNRRHSAWEADVLPLNYARRHGRHGSSRRNRRSACDPCVHARPWSSSRTATASNA